MICALAEVVGRGVGRPENDVPVLGLANYKQLPEGCDGSANPEVSLSYKRAGKRVNCLSKEYGLW